MPRNLGRRRYLCIGCAAGVTSHCHSSTPYRICASTSASANGPCTKSPKPTCPPRNARGRCEIWLLPLDNPFAVPLAPLVAPDSPRRHPLTFSRFHLPQPVCALTRLRCNRTLAQLPSSDTIVTTAAVDTALSNPKASSLRCPPSDSLATPSHRSSSSFPPRLLSSFRLHHHPLGPPPT